ncbi:MAG: PhoX family phosphatase [Pseudomonadota bacterium]
MQGISRRTLLKGSLAMAAAFTAHGCATTSGGRDLIGFRPVPRTTTPGRVPVISPDYEYQTLIPWGTPLAPDGPRFNHPPTAADQAQQVGIGHDGMAFFPTSDDGREGLLVINHEFGRNPHLLGVDAPTTLEQVRTSQHAHGASVVAIRKTGDRWERIASPANRRIHANTPMSFSGPVAGHDLLKNRATNTPKGTFANCSNGRTPWGTYLTCEENFNLYFSTSGTFEPDEVQARYGLSASGARYDWHKHDPRFDLTDPMYSNETHRFGWVVEIDPNDPTSNPVKRTALGRFKHEGAAVVEGRDGRVVTYMGDDQGFEFIYKFVSKDNWQTMRTNGQSPFDHGTLYVARFDDGGTGEWIPLTMSDPRLKARFSDQAEILTFARIAGTLVGATPMDRPEWTSVAPDGWVYCTLTNNSRRETPDAANPMAPNRNGHIIRWQDADDHLGTSFQWDIFLIADNHYESEEGFGSPDGLWADPDGRVFIMTDGRQPGGMNDQLLVADSVTGKIARLLTGVPACEVTGLTTTPDRRTLFVNIQHPGYGDPKLTNFPASTDGVTVPRDCTLAIRRKDGGIVGS